MSTDYVLETDQLSKRYGRRWGLRDCTLRVPTGRIAGLVGPNGAGKSTLLRLAAGLALPNSGSVSCFGRPAGEQDPALLARISYLDQSRPLYRTWTVGDILSFGRRLNSRFDSEGSLRRLADLGIGPERRVRSLSVGQQAQVSLALCLGKQADLLLLDEPAAALDPLARSQLVSMLLEEAAEREMTVLLSSHAVAELGNVCDYLVILSSSRVQLAGELERIIAGHRLLIGPRRDSTEAPPGVTVVHRSETNRQSTWLVRTDDPVADARWEVVAPSLEEIVLAYLQAPSLVPAPTHNESKVEVTL